MRPRLIPLQDENRSLTTPHITRALIIVNVVVFFVTWIFGLDFLEDIVWKYGMIPQYVIGGRRIYTLLTSIFLHGGIIHLGLNMLYLYIFGDNIEDAFGHGRYLAFYLLSGFAAGLAHILTTMDPMLPTIGASGAVSGVLGAYLVLYPRARILALVLFFWIAITSIPAVFFLAFWFVFQLLYGTITFAFEISSGTAYWAHIGGFVAGMILALTVRKKRKMLRSSSSYNMKI